MKITINDLNIKTYLFIYRLAMKVAPELVRSIRQRIVL